MLWQKYCLLQTISVTIATNDQSHIFERFYRAEKTLAGKFKGSGIGLALVKQIIDLLGGKINVSCPEAGGVEFVVELPVQKPLL